MASSWFNIKGNLSSIASNVTNFTKEVLQDVTVNNISESDSTAEPEFASGEYSNASEDYSQGLTEYNQGSEEFSNANLDYGQSSQQYAYNYYGLNAPDTDNHQYTDHLLNQIAQLQQDLQNLGNENSYKNNQINYLQNAHEETRKQYDNHFQNLKDNLLEKEREIEQFSQKYDLKAQLREHSMKNKIDSDWTDNWGSSVDDEKQKLEDLKFENECLTNNLTMKEILINVIEVKMSEISASNVDITDFSTWIDKVLEERIHTEAVANPIDKINLEDNWRTLCSKMGKYIENDIEDSDNVSVDFVENWIHNLVQYNEKLMLNNEQFEKMISTVEKSIRIHKDGYNSFKIDDFSEWLDSLSGSNVNCKYYNGSSKEMLEKIEKEIKEIDEEDSGFKIENFSIWLEKVQCKIDDLEVEVINEQDTREAEEKQRIVERETLNDLFKQKQNEISLLKVELYNLRSSHALHTIVEYDQEELMTVHEQLNETTARCEALQNELVTFRNSEGLDELAKLNNDYENSKEQLSKVNLELSRLKEDYTLLTQQFSKISEENGNRKSKCDSLKDTENSEETLDQIKTQLEKAIANEASLIDEVACLKVKNKAITRELNEFEIEHNSVFAKLDKSIEVNKNVHVMQVQLQRYETSSQDLQIHVQELSNINDCITDQLQTSKSSRDSIEAKMNEIQVKYESVCTKNERLSFDLQEAYNRYELLQAAETVSDSLQLQLNDLSSDKEALQGKLSSSESFKESALLEIADWKTKYSSLAGNLEELSTSLAEMGAKYKTNADTLQCVEEQSKEYLIQLEILQHREVSLQKELDEFCTQNEKLQSHRKELTEINQFLRKQAEIDLQENQKLKETNADILVENKHFQMNLENERNCLRTVETELHDIKTEYNLLKLVQLQGEEQKEKIQCEVNVLKDVCREKEKEIDGFSETSADLSLISSILTSLLGGTLESADLKVNVSNESFVSLFGIIKDLADKYSSLKDQCTTLIETVEEYKGYKNDLDGMEIRMKDMKQLHNILVYVISSVGDVLPEGRKGLITLNEVIPIDIAIYKLYMKSLQDFIQSVKQKEVTYLQVNNDYQEELISMQNQLQKEQNVKEEYISKVGTLDITIENYEKEIHNLKCKIIANKEQNTDQKKKYAIEGVGNGEGKDSCRSGGGSSGGMKFGAMKRRLLDLEAKNESLIKENEVLKSSTTDDGSPDSLVIIQQVKTLKRELSDRIEEIECYKEECNILKSRLVEVQQKNQETISIKERLLECENLIASSSSTTNELSSCQYQEQLHSLSLMVTEKNETIEKYKDESAHLKSKLLKIQNEISDLELIREECKQLKAMLVEKEHQDKINDTIMMLQEESKQLKSFLNEKEIELQNLKNIVLEKEHELSDLDLIREECKQLKHMLALKSSENYDYEMATNNDTELIELRNSNSDMELLREECQQLKRMLLNSSSEISEKKTCETVSNQLLEAMVEDRDTQISELQDKVVEIDSLKTMCNQLRKLLSQQDSAKLDISIPHVNSGNEEGTYLLQLQKIEETLIRKDADLKSMVDEQCELKYELTAVKNECQTLKTYLSEKEKIIMELQNDLDIANGTLQEKNSDLKIMNSLLKDREMQIEELKYVINAKETEISDLKEEISGSLANDETMHILQTEYRKLEERLRLVENDFQRSQNECHRLQLYAEQNTSLNLYLRQKDEELALLRLQTSENSIKESDIMGGLHIEISDLKDLFNSSQQRCNEISIQLEQKVIYLNEQKEHFEKTKIELEMQKHENKALLHNCTTKEEGIKCLNEELSQMQEKYHNMVAQIEAMKKIADEKQLSNEENVADNIPSNLEKANLIVDDIRNILEASSMKGNERGVILLIKQLSDIENSLKTLLLNICRTMDTKSEKQEAICGTHLIPLVDTLLTVFVSSGKQNFLLEQQNSAHRSKIQDLQNQLLENDEIKILYQTKNLEYNDLEQQMIQLENLNKELTLEHKMSPKFLEEMNVLRSELERSSYLYLDKNKECDNLKIELLQLEESVYQLRLQNTKLKGCEQSALALETTLRNNEEEINNLTSSLEDKEILLENSKREKKFLDGLIKEKTILIHERDDLLHQKVQSERLLNEKDVLLHHKDVTCKELDAKTTRELERLRNHLVMIEESHTRDIVELQNHEEELRQELQEAKQGLSKKSIILQDSNKQFQDHCVDLEEQLHTLAINRDSLQLELSKSQENFSDNAMAIYNLQTALEQLEKEKLEEYEFNASLAKRKEMEYESRIEDLSEELSKTKSTMAEAALAVQGINKLNMELQQKENELKISKEKVNELVVELHHMEVKHVEIMEAVDQKLDKSLLTNLLMKYFQSPEDKRADIVKVIGGLLGWSQSEIKQIGNGNVQSRLGGFINSVWAFGSPKKSNEKINQATSSITPTYDPNKSLSELFVKFLENETTKYNSAVDTASLTLSSETSEVPLFVSSVTPDILASHNKSKQNQRIPAPGQEIPRVHTHHAQSTLKTILKSTPY